VASKRSFLADKENHMRSSLCVAILGLAGSPLLAEDLFSQTPTASPSIVVSSWLAPDGFDGDQWAWDNFTLPATADITAVRWTGGYAFGMYGGHPTDFMVSIYPSNGSLNEPRITNLPDGDAGA
jgi:hypothetical protein